MTRDDIIRTAREAGMVVYEGEQDRVLFDGSIVDALTRFANLVAAAEREQCAKLLDEMAAADKLSNYYQVAALRIRERGAP